MAHRVIGAAIEVHDVLGPGLLESNCEAALCVELGAARLLVKRQAEIVVDHNGRPLRGQRLDLLVEGNPIVEHKSVASMQDVHAAQLLSHLRAPRLPLGLLIDFNRARLRDGLRRIISERAIPTSSASRPSCSTEFAVSPRDGGRALDRAVFEGHGLGRGVLDDLARDGAES